MKVMVFDETEIHVLCVCVGAIDIPFLAVTQEQRYIQGEGICLLDEVLWWEGACRIALPRAFGQVSLLRPSSFVFLM